MSIDAHTLPCDRCGERVDEDDLIYIEPHNEYLCEDCSAEQMLDDETR
jgi:DNA-directed RNA polymerase subunit RPC12/RpoP